MKMSSGSFSVRSSGLKKQNTSSENDLTTYSKNENARTNNKSRKNNLVFQYFKSAARSVVRAFTIFRPPPRNPSPAPAMPKTTRNTSLVRTSFSTDLSAVSNTTTRGSSVLKSYSSYGSSSTASGLLGTYPSFSINEIYKATENFSAANKIGEGGFGAVYRGKLQDGSLVAIKHAKKNAHNKRIPMEYKAEIKALSKIEHLNLVKLYGYVEQGDEKAIIVEYVGNGNLREHLDGQRGSGLEIASRLDIAIDVAHAITYLHMYTDPPIIHRDIKASNILITEKLRAKVADFGFARLATGDAGFTHISTQVKGTTGYLDPEYLRTYQLTEKSDVYSFGVLLVEIITGRRPIDHRRPSAERVTIKWAMQMLKEGDGILVMDPILRRSPAANMVVLNVLKLAKKCLDLSRSSRPPMKECAEALWGIRKEYREKTISSSSSAATSYPSANFQHRDARKNRAVDFGIEDSDEYQFVSA